MGNDADTTGNRRWSPGHVVAEKYVLVGPLGRGGMGEVWRARHAKLGSFVALKRLDAKLAANPVARSRFLREAKAAAALRSPHVIQIHDYGLDGDTAFIAMELLDGESLATRLGRGPLSPESAWRVIDPVLRAIAKAHEQGFVHRDLKPDNVFLVATDPLDRDAKEESWLVKVLDFGIAKQLEEIVTTGDASTASLGTASGAIIGTPHYMSPEQARAKPVDGRSDLWSVGVMTFECLLGRRPFVADSFGGLVLAICADPLPVPSELGDVPAGFDAWFAKALERDPSRRFGSAREMAEALRGVLDPSDDEPLADTPSAPVRDAVAVAPPRGLRRAVVVVGMAAGAAAVAFALSRGPSQVASAPSGAASVDPSAELPAPQAVPTTRQATFVGSVRRPALSPDGRQVHYLARDGKDVVLWKKDVATDRADEQLRLFRYSDLEVSPDGKSVLVLGIRSGETEPHGFLVDEAGRAEVLDVPFHTVAWTSDGSALVGLRNSAGRTLRVWPFEGPARDVPLAGDYQWIGSLHTVPGSARILVETASADDEARLFAFDPDGSTAERVDLGRTTWTAVAASRDTLFVLTKPAPSSDLLAFPFDGARVGVPRRLLTGLRADELTVSADGTRIAFTQAHVRSNVWGIESKTGRRVELTRGTRQHDAPRLSPDGSRVAFVRTEETGTLVVMPAAGGPETRLSRPEVEVLAFAWAPEGDKLVALTRQGKDVTTTLFAADAGEPQKSVVSATGASFAAAAEPKGMTPLAWDPGADVLLQQAGNQNFLRVDPKTGATTPLLPEPRGWVFDARSNLAGDVAVFRNVPDDPPGPSGVWLVPHGAGTPRRLASGRLRPSRFANDGKHLYVVAENDVGVIQRVERLTLDGGASEPVFTFDFEPSTVTSVDVSGDGTRIVCSVLTDERDLAIVDVASAAPQ